MEPYVADLMLLTFKSITIALGILSFGLLERGWPWVQNLKRRDRLASLQTNLSLALINISLSASTLGLLSPWVLAQPTPGLLRTLNPIAQGLLLSLILDGYLYSWHRLMHSSNWGWRLHAIHHTEPYLNSTSAYRFHSLEVLLSSGPKLLLIWLLGVPGPVVAIYEGLYALGLLFQHSNWALNPHLDRHLSPLIVTPNYHRHHHSQTPTHQHSNYASGLTLWDKLGRTQQNPRSTQKPTIGLLECQTPPSLWGLLSWPWRQDPT